jgi:hypothetical protein
MFWMISIALERLLAWNPVLAKLLVSSATETGVSTYESKSMPRITVDVDGMDMDGLRTAVAAFAAS